MSDRNEVGLFFIGFVLGGLVGAVVALLYAPQSGEETAGIGPTWFGLFGSEVELSDGTTVIADEAFIIESIGQPQAKIVRGFENQQMPQYSFTNDELSALVAYIKTLK